MTTACILLAAILLYAQNATAKCVPLNGTCSGTLLHRCCGSLKCERHGLFAGICRICFLPGAPCVRNAECCSHRCRQITCMEF
ncbi:hypothetical protein EG68_00555 [Paragonimus skrjabini miyazakii]|uniref:UPF0506 domain-containing protein n=1 Tax=Paragonimus skrjabini miyazakii TaxID=59628 RepID=A0A8S9Z5X9_9TREM|nr:hypothetical protein EG68_00555 [Paragonimus skrjabini miyazakii]